MATANPFDVKTSATKNGGLVSSANPALAGSPTPAPPPPATSANATTTPAAVTQAQVAQGKGTEVAFDPTKQTVAGQLEGIVSKGSPLFEQATTRAIQDMASRGLVNSSMAQQAGQAALYDKALQIATPDAQTYQQTALANADITNQFEMANTQAKNTNSQFNASEANSGARFNADQANTTSRQNAQSQTQVNLANLDAQTKTNLQVIDAQTRENLAAVEASYKTLMQSSQSASDLYRQTIDAMSQITMNKDLDAPAKQAALTQQTQLLQNGMKLLGSINNLNLSGLLNFGDVVTTPGSTVGTPKPAPAPAPKPALEWWEQAKPPNWQESP